MIDLYFLAGVLSSALDVAELSAFYAPDVLHPTLPRRLPLFQTPVLSVPHAIALSALHDVAFCAVLGLVTHLVALEAHLLVAVERVVGVFTAQNARL